LIGLDHNLQLITLLVESVRESANNYLPASSAVNPLNVAVDSLSTAETPNQST